jgi:NADH-quinone oxidoreductase subunit K
MTELALQHYLAVGAIMFVIGMIGFMTPPQPDRHVPVHGTDVPGRRDQPDRLRPFHGNLGGQAFVIFVLVIAAAEASLALGLVVLLFRQRATLDADAWRELKGIVICHWSTGHSRTASDMNGLRLTSDK